MLPRIVRHADLGRSGNRLWRRDLLPYVSFHPTGVVGAGAPASTWQFFDGVIIILPDRPTLESAALSQVRQLVRAVVPQACARAARHCIPGALGGWFGASRRVSAAPRFDRWYRHRLPVINSWVRRTAGVQDGIPPQVCAAQ